MSLLSSDRFTVGQVVHWRGAFGAVMQIRGDQVWVRKDDGTDLVVHRVDLDVQQWAEPPSDVS